jgi:CheY-like chemotaxis protein
VIRLPRREAGDIAAPESATAAIVQRRQPALVLDDEAEIAALLSDMLAREGFDCEVVDSGEAALKRLAAGDYALILCDLRMPGVDGAAVFEWLSQNRPHLCARVGFVTGDTLGSASEGFLARAARPVLEKPFMPSSLRQLLAEIGVSTPR